MPQLDANTFIYQYVGIISLVISIYVILSYIVLPILLRSILIRNYFLATHTALSTTLNLVSSNYSAHLVFHKPIYVNSLLNGFFIGLTSLLTRFVGLLKAEVLETDAIAFQNNLKTFTKFFSFQSFSLDYLILFLLVDYEENEEN